VSVVVVAVVNLNLFVCPWLGFLGLLRVASFRLQLSNYVGHLFFHEMNRFESKNCVTPSKPNREKRPVPQATRHDMKSENWTGL
jgi:hypothetical protein